MFCAIVNQLIHSRQMYMAELIHQTFEFNSRSIGMVGTWEHPWFCGNDIATALGYKRPKYAVQDHVIQSHKKSLDEVIQGGGKTPPPCELNLNDLNTICGVWYIRSYSEHEWIADVVRDYYSEWRADVVCDRQPIDPLPTDVYG